MTPITLRFVSELHAPRPALWQWITSVQGIRRETMPLLRMTAPAGVASLADLRISPGERVFRSTLLLGGVLPVDFLDLTLTELEPGVGFVEQSPMGSMRRWRHARRLLDVDGAPARVRLIDELAFEPRVGRRLAQSLVRYLFSHRHRVLRATFGGFAMPP
jgi:ligand-binding SRPBCC domain-containing protein